MEMTPVESSHISAVGYENGTLFVSFKDGAQYEYADISEAAYKELLASPSKGKMLREYPKGTLVSKRDKPLAQTPDRACIRPVHTSQAEGCCQKPINKASLSGVLDKMEPWACPKCGTTYKPKAFGPLVHWEAQCDVIVFKP